MQRFFDIALGNYNSTQPGIRHHLVREFRGLIRHECGSELLGVDAVYDEGMVCGDLFVWWGSGEMIHRLNLFWSLD
jgi:hypothetical protein